MSSSNGRSPIRPDRGTGDTDKPNPAARHEAETRHGAVRADAERGGLSRRLLGAGLESYRRGWIPEALMGLVAPAFIGRELAFPLVVRNRGFAGDQSEDLLAVR